MGANQQILSSFEAAAGGVLGTPSLLDTSGNLSASSTHASGSISPSASTLIIVCATWRSSSARTLSSLANGGTLTTGSWTIAANFASSSGLEVGHAVAWATYTSGSGAVTLTYSGGVSRSAVGIIEITGADTTTPFINIKTASEDEAASGTDASLTLDSTPSAGNMVLGLLGNYRDSAGITPGTNFTELADFNSGGGGLVECQIQYDLTTLGTTVDWTSIRNNEDRSYSGLELQVA